jgi:predicted small secreted protein
MGVKLTQPLTPGDMTMKALIAAILAGSFLLTACNTMEGFGRDVEKTGNKIEQKAQEKK